MFAADPVRRRADHMRNTTSPVPSGWWTQSVRSRTDCRLANGVLIGPGLTTFERIRRSFRSLVQVRTKELDGSLLAVYVEGGSAFNTRDRAVENDRATIIQ